MLTRLRRTSFQASSLLALVLTCHAALAEPAAAVAASPAFPGATPLADSLTGMAKADYAAAKILYEDGDNAGALLKLKAAHDSSKDPRLLWNMAACEKNLRHYAEVGRLVTRYLAEGGALLSAQDRADGSSLVSTVRGFVSDLSVSVDQPGATVLVDELPIGQSPLPAAVGVDMGQHKIRVRKAGFVDYTNVVELAGGQPFSVTAVLVAEKHEGQLRVLSGPSDVIQVDHKTSKVGLWEGVLPSGTHSVFVTGNGKRAHQTDVIIQDNDLTNLHVTLETDEKPLVEKSKVPTWLWVAGGVVVVGGGLGAYLLMKPDSQTKYQSPTPGTWGTIDI